MASAHQPEAGPPLLPTPELTWDELESFLDGLLERLQRLPGADPRLPRRIVMGAGAMARRESTTTAPTMTAQHRPGSASEPHDRPLITSGIIRQVCLR